MMRKAVAVLLLAVAAGGAEASCVQFTASAINVTYDPLGKQGVLQVSRRVVLMAAKNNDGIGPEVTAQFADQDPGTLRVGTNGPVYTIARWSKVVAVSAGAVPTATTNSFTFRFDKTGAGSQEVFGVRFFIDPGQDVAAGIYSDDLGMQMRCGGTNGNQPVDLQPGVLHITVDVPSTLIANLAGGSAHGTLDFGDFSSPTRTARVNVYSTGPYALSIASRNKGVMKLQGAPSAAADARNAEIGYSMTFDGRPVSAGTPVRFERTGVGGTGLPLSVTAEPVAGKRAGVYRDSITLTFTPLATL